MADKDSSKEKKDSISIFQKFLIQLKTYRNYINYENLAKVGNAIGTVIDISKKIMFSTLISRTVTVSTVIIAIAGLSTISPAVAIVSLGAVSAGIIIDTYLVGKTRALQRESRYLARHRLAKDTQDKILTKSPELKRALEQKLYTPIREGKKSVTKRYFKNNQDNSKSIWAYVQGTTQTLIKNAVTIFEAIVSREPASVLKAVGSTAFGINSTGKENITMEKKRDEFRRHIDSERGKSDSPGYNNRHELKLAAREQKIQALVLMELTKNNDYKKQSDATIRQRYDDIKKRIEQTEKAISNEYRPVAILKNIAMNTVRTHNPFSIYNDPNKLTTELKTKNVQIYERKSITKKLYDKVKSITKNSKRKETKQHIAPSLSKNIDIPKPPPLPSFTPKSQLQLQKKNKNSKYLG